MNTMENQLLPGWTLEKPPRPKKKKRGRPKKKKIKKKPGAPRKKHRFEETPVGFLLKNEAPLEYSLILEVWGTHAPDPDFIENFSYASINPLFKKAKFRRALKHYRDYGLYSGTPKKATPATELYYSKVRKNNLVR